MLLVERPDPANGSAESLFVVDLELGGKQWKGSVAGGYLSIDVAPDGTNTVASTGDGAGGFKLTRVNFMRDGGAFLVENASILEGVAISPDGATVAFTQADGVQMSSHLQTVPMVGGGTQVLTSPIEGQRGDDDPSWAPNGELIAFHRSIDGVQMMYTITPEGTEEKVLSEGMNPEWSPDGESIAFRDGSGLRRGLAVISLGSKDVTEFEVDEVLSFAWSPDGSMIAFEMAVEDRNTRIGIVDVSSGGVTMLTSGDHRDSWPVWAPNSERIAVTRRSQQTESLTLVGLDGTVETTDWPGRVAAWNLDSDWIE